MTPGQMFSLAGLACLLLIVVAIPVAAWRGHPKGFTRLNWTGVAVLTGVVGGLLLALATATEREDMAVARVVGILGLLLLASTLGSLGALFFHRPKK